MIERARMPICPMAETCKGMTEKSISGVVMIIPGNMFIILGILIFFEPRIIAWVLAIAFVLIGVMLLIMANFMRKMSTNLKNN